MMGDEIDCVVGMTDRLKHNYIEAEDLVAIILSDKCKRLQFRWVRILCDLFFVVLGYLLGGTVGVGTIIAVFLTGPMVQFWLPRTKKIIQGILKESV